MIRGKTSWHLLLAVLLISPFYSYAQTDSEPSFTDLKLWSALGVEKSFIDKKLNLSLQHQFRFNSNITQVDNHFTQAGLQFKLNDHISLAYGFRYIQKNREDEGFATRHRSHFDLTLKEKYKRLRLSGRVRFQEKHKVPEVFSDIPETKYRFRVKGTYNLRKTKINPHASAEIFYVPESNEYTGFEKIRLTAGFNRKYKKLGTLNTYYRLEKQLASYSKTGPMFTYHIIGINYTFKL